jgi:hypothetical protein
MYYGSGFVNTNVPENNLQLKTTWRKVIIQDYSGQYKK